MKRMFDKKPCKDSEVSENISTLESIVKEKDTVKQRIEEEERAFFEKKKEYEMQMIKFEKEEISKRQQEVDEKILNLEEHKRKNELVEETVEEQIKFLSTKLKEYKTNHRSSEEELETEISNLRETISEVHKSMLERSSGLSEDDIDPSAPQMRQWAWNKANGNQSVLNSSLTDFLESSLHIASGNGLASLTSDSDVLTTEVER